MALIILCFISAVFLNFLSWWLVGLGLIAFAILYLNGKKMLLYPMRWSSKIIGRPKNYTLESYEHLVGSLNILKSVFWSLTYLVLSFIQVSFLLKSLGAVFKLDMFLIQPFIAVINFLPLTVGGFGTREAIAAVLLASRGVSEAVSVPSVAIVIIFNVVFPALVGLSLRLCLNRQR